MDLMEYFNSLDLDLMSMLKAAGILIAGILIVGMLGRFVFGKRSSLNAAVSSAIAILFIYAVTIVLNSAGAQFRDFIAPLPFIAISGDNLVLLSLSGADYTVICSTLLSMVILVFLVNLVDRWVPKGKKLFGWLFFRCLTVAIAYCLHLAVVWLFTTYLPEGIVTYAPAILLGLLVLMLLTGALKLLVGILLTTVNPLIGALYTFFFANIVGKQITRAVLTTALLTGFVYLLETIGYSTISIASAALIAYLPFLLILIGLWYLVYKVL